MSFSQTEEPILSVQDRQVDFEQVCDFPSVNVTPRNPFASSTNLLGQISNKD